MSANDGGAGVPTHVLVAAIFAMLTERGSVPKTSSPQQSFKDVIRAHFSSPVPMPAHIVNRVMKTYAGRDGTDLDLVRLLRDLRFLISEREQEPRSQPCENRAPRGRRGMGVCQDLYRAGRPRASSRHSGCLLFCLITQGRRPTTKRGRIL